MADDADRAAPRIEQAVETGIARARLSLPDPRHAREDCAECGDPLPFLRAERGYLRCVPCQEQHER